MSCPTCDHTMQSIRTGFWCPRCGTLTMGGDIEAPSLVQRCREFGVTLHNDDLDYLQAEWQRLGIAETIDLPEADAT